MEDLKTELEGGLSQLSSEVSELLTAIQQVKQSLGHMETRILSRNKLLEESLLTKQQKQEDLVVQSMLTQLEERVLLTQQGQHDIITRKQQTSAVATKLLLNQLNDRMSTMKRSLHSTIQLKHTQLTDIKCRGQETLIRGLMNCMYYVTRYSSYYPSRY